MEFLAYLIVPLLLGLWAQWKVKSTFGRWSQVGSLSGVTGEEAARRLLRAEGITDVAIEPTEGTWKYYVLVANDPPSHFFTDDYDEFLEAKSDAQADGVF